VFLDATFMDRRGLPAVAAEVAAAERAGVDGVWSVEMDHDPFLSLAVAATHTGKLTLGTGVAVAFARTPMTVALAAHDLQQVSAGRFVLGLGSQIRAHVERRYSMPWSRPAARMREFVLALRAIWAAWDTGDRLDFRGEFYRHTLMTPVFTPPHLDTPPPPVMVAAVGPHMTRVAGEVCDGVVAHGFTTERYLRTVTLPTLAAGAAAAGRPAGAVQVVLPGLVATGVDDASRERATAAVRAQIAFYGSTPAYRGVLEEHGRGDQHEELYALSRQGRWDDMTALVDDELLHTVAIVGTPEEVGTRIRDRYTGLVDRFVVTSPATVDEESLTRVVAAARPSD
jgi:probable F420-dependent oxidoreductase